MFSSAAVRPQHRAFGGATTAINMDWDAQFNSFIVDQIDFLGYPGTSMMESSLKMDEDILDSWLEEALFDSASPSISTISTDSHSDYGSVKSEEALAEVITESPTASEASPVETSNTCTVCHREEKELQNHYGGRCCSSCRAFFRRAVTNNNYAAFACGKKRDCPIDSRSRRSCTWCRFQKCLSAGMNPAWTMSDEERKRRRERKVNRVLARAPTTVSRPLELEWTQEEGLMVQRIKSYGKECMVNYVTSKLYDNIDFSLHFCSLMTTNTKTSPSYLRMMEDQMRDMFCSIALGMEDMCTLDEHDRVSLVTNNFRALFMRHMASRMHEKDLAHQVRSMRDAIRERVDYHPVLVVMDAMMRDFKESDGRELRIDYDQLYVSPWAESADAEARHRQLMLRIQRWPRAEPSALIDSVLGLLGFLTLLYSPMALTLRARSAVEQVQQRYALMLFRYLKKTYRQQAAAKFADGMEIIALAEEAYQIHSRMLPV